MATGTLSLDATTLWDTWDASPPTLEKLESSVFGHL